MNKLLYILITLISFPLFGNEIVPNWRDDLVAQEYEAFGVHAQREFNFFTHIDRRVPNSHPNMFLKIVALDPEGTSIHFDNNLIWMVHPNDQARIKKWEQNDVYFIAVSEGLLGYYRRNGLNHFYVAPLFHAINYTKRDSALVYLDFIPDPTQTKTLKIAKFIEGFYPKIELNDGKQFTIFNYWNPNVENQDEIMKTWEVNDRVIVLLGNRIWGGDNHLFNLDKRTSLRRSYYNFKDGSTW